METPIPPDVTEVVEISRAGAILRLYRPDGGEGTAVYARGGDWVAGTLDTHDILCRTLANRSTAVVAAIDYSRAPTRRHPAQIREVTAVVRWLQRAGQPIALVGDGVGAYLAVQAAVIAVREDIPVVAVGLIYPVTGPDPRPSSEQDAPVPTTGLPSDLGPRWAHYVAEHPDPGDPPVRLGDLDLAGLPSTLILTAVADPRRHQAEQLAASLEAAGVVVDRFEHAGLPHDFLRPVVFSPGADEALTRLAEFLEPRLGEPNSFAGRPN